MEHRVENKAKIQTSHNTGMLKKSGLKVTNANKKQNPTYITSPIDPESRIPLHIRLLKRNLDEKAVKINRVFRDRFKLININLTKIKYKVNKT